MTSILRLTIELSRTIYSSLFPKLPEMRYPTDVSKLDDSQRLVFLRNLERALLKNLSFLLEPMFRLQVWETLKAWTLNQSNFDDTKASLLEAYDRRSRLISRAFPQTGLRKTISSAGFFSFLVPQKSRTSSIRSLSLESVIRRASLLLHFPLSQSVAVLRDMKLSREVSELAFSPGTLDFLRGGIVDRLQVKSGVQKWCLIIGPSDPNLDEVEAWEGEIFVLVTPSFDLQILSDLIERFGATPILNNVAASDAVIHGGQLLNLIAKAKAVYVASHFVESLVSKFGVSAKSSSSRFLLAWDTGNPNLLQRAVGVALQNGYRIQVTGANLYAARGIYDLGLRPDPRALRGSSRVLHEFFTCISYSSHDPVSNFIFIKRLHESGFLISLDTVLGKVLSGTLEEYLVTIEDTLGRSRK